MAELKDRVKSVLRYTNNPDEDLYALSAEMVSIIKDQQARIEELEKTSPRIQKDEGGWPYRFIKLINFTQYKFYARR